MKEVWRIAAAGALFALSTAALAQPLPTAPFPTTGQAADLSGQIVPLAPHQGGAEPISPNETHPNAKRLASEVALALTTYAEGEGVDAIASRLPAEAAELAGTFFQPGTWSTGRIIYPQLGGLERTSASVMVVVERLVGDGQGVIAEWRTLDIRLRRAPDGPWRFAGLASAGGDRLPVPATLSAEALAVLNDPRIEMPDSARWDIYSGLVSPNLLAVMVRMAGYGPYGVITFSTGHPWEVFGTDRQSDHSRGRAVDIYRLGDDLVIDNRAAGSVVHEFAQWLYAQPDIRQIGSPWELDPPGTGVGGRSFTDALHQDHLHVAVYP